MSDIDLSKYTDDELLEMLKQKQKEYLILTQSERVAKMILDYYGEELLAGKYHDRVNREYDVLYRRAARKKLFNEPLTVSNLGIPKYSVIARLEDSRDELLANGDPRVYQYSRMIEDISDNIKYCFYQTTIVYKDGYLYLVDDDSKEETLITKDSLANFLEGGKKKTLE